MPATPRMAEATRRFACLVAGFLLSLPAFAQNPAESGRQLFANAGKGNCIACHQVPGDESQRSFSRIGPSLSDVKARIPDRARLRAIIWDPLAVLPNSVMPPYGRNRILTEAEIDAVVAYLETL
jgi:sulfur-oxidizing protein SoxX